MISTVNGKMPIEELKSGDKVYSYNIDQMESLLRLMRFDTVLNHWVTQGGTVDTLNHFVSLYPVYQFSSWTFYSPSRYFVPRVKR